jgi:CelD/BcsL family acetyltransferase involved in cellulose biosynthesis
VSTATGTTEVSALVPLGVQTQALDDEWAALADACQASPFLYPGVVRAWATAFAPGPIELATVRRDGALVAALPVVRQRGRIASAGNWHTVESGMIAVDDAAANAAAAAVFSTRPRSVTLELLDAASAATLRAQATRAGFRTVEETMIESPYMELTGSYEELLASWSGKRRADHRRRRRRLDERGEVSFGCARGDEEAMRAYEELLELEAQGWKAAQGTSIALSEDTARYYRELVLWGGERGWLRLHVLRLDGRALAVALGLEAHGVFYGIKMGADPALRNVSPAVLMVDEIVRDGYERGLTRFEMLGANDSYKQQWCEHAHPRIRLRAYGPSLAGRLDHAEVAYARPLARRLRTTAMEQARRARAAIQARRQRPSSPEPAE